MAHLAVTARAAAWPALAAAAWLLAGCSTLAPPGRAADTVACTDLFAQVDARVERAGVRDADSAELPGFAFLRINRLLASLGATAADDPARRAAWLEQLAALDADGRAVEMAALDAAPAARRAQLDALNGCRQTLVAAVARDTQALARLRDVARVPDAYRTWQRVLGLYPLAALAARPGVARLQRDEMPRAVDWQTPPPNSRVYGLPVPAPGASAPLPRDVLDLPTPDAATLAALLERHAPTWIVDTAGAADVLGASGRDGDTISVDTAAPTVYSYPSYTRFDGRVLLQLNYVVWFAERPVSGPFDLLGGPLDGLTWRVTLDVDGHPLVFDTMHNCGCYHLWLPTARLQARATAHDSAEPPWIPFSVDGARRLALHLAAGTHYVRAVGAAPAHADTTLAHRPYDDLRRLPQAHGRTRSLFAPDGLVHESRRPERWVLWPLGVPSAGAMRQRGHHATAFVGTRHFDDATAIERYFERASPLLDGGVPERHGEAVR